MSEDTKKVDRIELEEKAAELSEQDLDNVAGGQDLPKNFGFRSNIKTNLE